MKTTQEDKDKVLLEKAKEVFTSGDEISIPIIQIELRCGYFQAARLFDALEKKTVLH